MKPPFQIPNILESLKADYIAGNISIKDAHKELKAHGWSLKSCEIWTREAKTEKAPRLHSSADSRTPAQRDAYDQGQDDYDADDVDDLRAMRCEFYAAGARSAHYTAAEQG